MVVVVLGAIRVETMRCVMRFVMVSIVIKGFVKVLVMLVVMVLSIFGIGWVYLVVVVVVVLVFCLVDLLRYKVVFRLMVAMGDGVFILVLVVEGVVVLFDL